MHGRIRLRSTVQVGLNLYVIWSNIGMHICSFAFPQIIAHAARSYDYLYPLTPWPVILERRRLLFCQSVGLYRPKGKEGASTVRGGVPEINNEDWHFVMLRQASASSFYLKIDSPRFRSAHIIIFFYQDWQNFSPAWGQPTRDGWIN